MKEKEEKEEANETKKEKEKKYKQQNKGKTLRGGRPNPDREEVSAALGIEPATREMGKPLIITSRPKRCPPRCELWEAWPSGGSGTTHAFNEPIN